MRKEPKRLLGLLLYKVSTVHMRWLWLSLLLLCAASIGAAQAQTNSDTSGSQDSTCGGPLRPRWGSYLIQTFPSPAHAGDEITIQYYNHNDETLSCAIYDVADRLMLELQPKQSTSAGLHTYTLKANALATGTYFIRLMTFTGAGSQDVVDNSRFVIIH